MSTVRVWLSGWEWACCGDPFAVGDAVSFACRPPRGDWWFLSEERSDDTKDAGQFGTGFAASVELVEEHHDEGDDDRPVRTVAGTVRAILAVVVDERVARTPALRDRRRSRSTSATASRWASAPCRRLC
ncbi:MAG: hypothetical protein JST33_15600 [Actinobacteria bacterium]|nr:hypothetical protein [Actinomycetota bacterium]